MERLLLTKKLIGLVYIISASRYMESVAFWTHTPDVERQECGPPVKILVSFTSVLFTVNSFVSDSFFKSQMNWAGDELIWR